MRYTAPIGLNMCPPFHSISKSLRAPCIIPPARTVIEDETRRNTFWMTYATERYYSSGNGWALAMDDQDISQLLPVTRYQFEHGVSTNFSGAYIASNKSPADSGTPSATAMATHPQRASHSYSRTDRLFRALHQSFDANIQSPMLQSAFPIEKLRGRVFHGRAGYEVGNRQGRSVHRP